jgi:archaellum component FlaC
MANEIGGISVKLSADVDTAGTVKGYAQIEQASQKIQKEFKETEAAAIAANASISKSTTNAASASNKATSAFKMQKGSIAQLGMQIQDVAVMSQFGADKFIILGTQGSQIASLFGPGGAVFGAVLAISAAIGGTLVKSIQAAKDAGTDLPKELMTRLEEIKERFLEVDEASRGAFLGVEFGKINQEYDALSEKIKITEQRILEQSSAFNGNGNAVTNSVKRLEKLKQEQKDLAELMEQLTKVSTADLGQSEIDFSASGSQAKSRLDDIKEGLQREQELYQTWRQTRAGITAGIISDEQAQLIQADVAAQQRINMQFDQTKARLEEERALLLENQTLTAEEKAARKAEIDAAEREADKLHQDQLSQQQIEYAEATAAQRVKIEKSAQQKINSLQSAAMNNAIGLLDQFAQDSKAAALASIALSKGLAIAQAIQNTGVAVMAAMAVDPTGALAARAKALGAINVAMIAATGLAQGASALSGSSSTEAYSNGVPATNTTSSDSSSSTEQRNISIALTGSGFSGGDIRGLISAINEELGDGVSLSATGG